MIPYRKFSKWGYSSPEGKIIIQPQFDRAWFFQSNGLAIVKNNGRQSLINRQGKIVTKNDYAIIGILAKDKIIAAKKVNGRGSELYYKEWVNLSVTGEELQTIPSKADIVELTGEKFIPPIACSLKPLEQKLEKDQFLLYTPDGNFLSSGSLQCLTENLFIAEAIVDTGVTRFGVINANLKTILPFRFSSIIGLLNNYILVSIDGKRGIYSLDGKEIIAPKYGNILKVADDYALIQLSSTSNLDESLGYVSLKGQEYFESNPIYQVSLVDEHTIITDQYQNNIGFPVTDFSEGSVIQNKYVLFQKDESHFLYSIDGDLLLQGEKITQLGDNRFMTENNFMLQVFDVTSKKIVYDSLHFASLLSDPYSNIQRGFVIRDKDNKYGVLSMKGEMWVKPNYSLINFNGLYFQVKNGLGEDIILDSTGNFQKHFGNAKIHFLSYYFFAVKEKDKHSLYDARNATFIYTNLVPVDDQTEVNPGIIKNAENLYGYINPNTETIVDPIYTDAGFYQASDNVNPYLIIYWFKKKNGKFDLYNTSHGQFIAVDLDKVQAPVANYFPITKNGKLMLIANSGTMIIENGLEDVRPGKSIDYLAIKRNGKYGIINQELEQIVSHKYEMIHNIIDEFAIATQNGQTGLIDLSDSLWIPFSYQSLQWLTTLEDTLNDRYLFMAEKEGKKGIVDQNNIVLTPFNIVGEVSFPFTQNYFVVTNNNKASLYDKESKIVLNNIGEKITAFPSEDEKGYPIAIVQTGTKYGLYNMSGQCLAPIEMDKISNETFYDFYERFYALIEKKSKLGFVSLNSGICLNPQLDAISHEEVLMVRNLVLLPVKIKNKWGVLKNYSSIMIPCQYDEIELNQDYYGNGFIRVKQNGKWGLLDTTGKNLLACQYDQLIIGEEFEGERFMECKKGAKSGLYSSKKGMLVPADYDKIGTLFIGQIGFTALKGKYFAVFDNNGKQILPCEMVKPVKRKDPAFPVTFIDKKGKTWGIGPNFEVKEIH